MKKDRSAIIFYLKFAILLVLVAAWGTELLLNFINRTQNLDSAQDKNFSGYCYRMVLATIKSFGYN